MDLGFMVDTMSQLARGVPLTLQLAATSVFLGFVLALGLALALDTGRRSIVWPIAAPMSLRSAARRCSCRSSSSTMASASFVRPSSCLASLGLLPRAVLVRHSCPHAQHCGLRHGDHSRRTPIGPLWADRGSARLRDVALACVSPGDPADRASASPAELRERDHSDDQGHVLGPRSSLCSKSPALRSRSSPRSTGRSRCSRAQARSTSR